MTRSRRTLAKTAPLQSRNQPKPRSGSPEGWQLPAIPQRLFETLLPQAQRLPLRASVLDDGILTASEVTALKLNTDWVALLACNTAAGDRPGPCADQCPP